MSDKLFKFFFQAKLSTLSLSLNFPCQISIVWKRGDKLAETKQRKPVIKGLVTFNESIAIECNMAINPTTKKFESKKTIMNVLIFTEKGTKQAGEVEVDVSEPLNQRMEEKEYEVGLGKCPDKSAKLKFKLNTYFKEEVQVDKISQSSYKTVDVVEVAGKINTPNFKKKSKDPQQPPTPTSSLPSQLPTSPRLNKALSLNKKLPKSQNNIKQNIEDINQKVYTLQDQNRKLKQDQKNLKLQQQTLIKQFEKKSMEANEWKQRSIEYQKELGKLYKYDKEIDEVDRNKKMLFEDILGCREKIALIFNAAFEIGGAGLADSLQEASGYVEGVEKVKERE